MLLSVNRISKSFEDRAVLSDVSFDIGEGEIVGFLGRTARGKRPRSKSSSVCSRPTPARYTSTG